MGEKGARLTDQANKSWMHIVQSLSDLENISSRKMFGGFGIFKDKTMFGLVNSNGVLFFKADNSTIPKFEKEGSSKHGRMPYYEVPDKISQDKNKLLEWASEAISIAEAGKK